jgi:hypothetical protein
LFPQIKLAHVKNLPISNNCEDSELQKLAMIMLQFRSDLSQLKIKFNKYVESQFTGIELTKKLQNYYDLGFGDFIKELNKAIKKEGGEKLTKIDEMGWMEVFETKKEEAQTLQAEIDKTDKEIDQMVYELYGLTEEEIKIVENS